MAKRFEDISASKTLFSSNGIEEASSSPFFVGGATEAAVTNLGFVCKIFLGGVGLIVENKKIEVVSDAT